MEHKDSLNCLSVVGWLVGCLCFISPVFFNSCPSFGFLESLRSRLGYRVKIVLVAKSIGNCFCGGSQSVFCGCRLDSNGTCGEEITKEMMMRTKEGGNQLDFSSMLSYLIFTYFYGEMIIIFLFFS